MSTERLERVSDLPANEHLSMQIARQIFGIRTAACGMIFFDDGSPGYITRRFDYKPDGTGKYQMEDFAILLAKTPEKDGMDFKCNASYLDIVQQIRQRTAATPVVLLEFFRLLVFNYLIANGDAHLKNFSLMETEQGDFVLSPAYDLLCTALHIDDKEFALHDRLYEGDYNEKTYYETGVYTRTSFLVFAEMAGILPELAGRIMDEIMSGLHQAEGLIGRSFLSEEGKRKYIEIVRGRQRNLGRG